MKIISVGFCGAGGIVASHHVPELKARSDRYCIAGFFDILPEKAKALAGGTSKAYPTYEDLLADRDVELAVIATKPVETHFPAAKKALTAGKHVLLEKPMAATTAECDELIALAHKKNLLLTVHHNRRLDLDFLAVRDIIARGKIGDPLLIVNRISCNAYQPGDILDWGIHLADQCLVLNHSPLTEVSAVMFNPAGGFDKGGYYEATLRFERPPVVRIEALPRPAEFLSNGTPAFARFSVIGTTGSFIQRTIEHPNDLMNATQNIHNFRPDYAVPDYLSISRKGYYDYLHESLRNGHPLFVKPEEARNAIRAFELIVESARTNRMVTASSGR